VAARRIVVAVHDPFDAANVRLEKGMGDALGLDRFWHPLIVQNSRTFNVNFESILEATTKVEP
jgi:hypothetical protein